MGFDWIYSLILVGIVLLGGAAYSVRVMLRGRARFDRVDRQGGSALLNKELMQAFYWCMQPIGKLLAFLHITPNQLSWASFFFALAAGVSLAFGHFGSGAVFGAISALLDSLDGLVARLTGVASDAGEVLDAAIDRYAEFLFIGGLVIYYREIPVMMLIALLALVGCFMVSYSTAKAEALQIDPPKGSMRRPERALYLILGAALSPVTIPMFEQVREFPVPIAHPMVMALGLIAVLANVSACERLYAIARGIRIREAEAAAARSKAARAELDAESAKEAEHRV